MSRPNRDLMAPDTEPTDEELALVMRAARDVAAARGKRALEELRRTIEERARLERANEADRTHDAAVG
jgi:hypothetical protein